MKIRIAIYVIIAALIQAATWTHISNLNATKEERIRHILIIEPTSYVVLRSNAVIKNVDFLGVSIMGREASGSVDIDGCRIGRLGHTFAIRLDSADGDQKNSTLTVGTNGLAVKIANCFFKEDGEAHWGTGHILKMK